LEIENWLLVIPLRSSGSYCLCGTFPKITLGGRYPLPLASVKNTLGVRTFLWILHKMQNQAIIRLP